MPIFLYSIKSCHSCAKRSECKKKNDPRTLISRPKSFEHVNRSTIRHGLKPTRRESFCRDYVPEEKTERIMEVKQPTSKKEIVLTKEALTKAMQENKELTIVDVWAPWCAPPSTSILSHNENKLISDIKIGDQTIYGNKVKDTFKRQYSGELVEIRGTGMLPFMVTPEHPVFVSNITKESIGVKRKFGNPSFILAGKLKRWYYGCEDGYAIVIPRLEGNSNQHFLSLSPYKKNKNKTHQKMKLNKGLAWFLGLYTADGSSYLGSHSRGEVEFSLSKKETIDKIKQIITNLNYSPFIKMKKGCVSVCIGSAIMARALSNWCGRDAHTKKIPNFIMKHSNKKIIESFISGYLAGDGYYNDKDKIWTASSVSKQLVIQFQLLLARLGKQCHIYKREGRNHIIDEKNIKGGVIYQLHIYFDRNPKQGRMLQITDKFIFSPIRSLKRIDYDGEVYNLETENNKYLLSNAIVHNCNPCKVISPIIEEVAGDYPQVKVIKVNVDEDKSYAEKHNIMGIPTLLFLRDNKEIDRIVGVVNKETIEKKIKELMR